MGALLSQKKYIYFTNLLIGLVALLAGPSLSEAKENDAPASGNRFLNFIRQRFSGGKQPQHQAVFTKISFSQMRGIINSNLTQDQIDFEIFREMVLNLVRRTPPGEGFQKLSPHSLSCKSLL